MSSCANPMQTRRTRFVCISDTHNQTPQLPKGDVLIHAGDLTNQGSLSELRKTVAWIKKADFEVKLVVAGNHDITLDSEFYSEHWSYFHNQHKQSSEDCISLLRDSPSITYLRHQDISVKLASLNGPHTEFKVFGSPYSPAHALWGFGYQDEDAVALWEQVPQDTDILITHTPPKNHCDVTVSKRPAGCEFLRKRLWSVRPKLHVCGHMHEGRGAERVYWNNEGPGLESKTEFWSDPSAGEGNKKQSLVDLTEKGRSGWFNTLPLQEKTVREPSSRKAKGGVGFSGIQLDPPTDDEIGKLKDVDSSKKSLSAHTIHHGKKKATIRDLAGRSVADEDLDVGNEISVSNVEIGGGSNTCIVNAAIMANSWGGPKRFNKPIVVDIDLPVWETDQR